MSWFSLLQKPFGSDVQMSRSLVQIKDTAGDGVVQYGVDGIVVLDPRQFSWLGRSSAVDVVKSAMVTKKGAEDVPTW
jgi:hypothetical protein